MCTFEISYAANTSCLYCSYPLETETDICVIPVVRFHLSDFTHTLPALCAKDTPMKMINASKVFLFFTIVPRFKFSALPLLPLCILITLPLGELLLISVSELFQQIYCNNEKSSYHILLSVNLLFFDKVANNW